MVDTLRICMRAHRAFRILLSIHRPAYNVRFHENQKKKKRRFSWGNKVIYCSPLTNTVNHGRG